MQNVSIDDHKQDQEWKEGGRQNRKQADGRHIIPTCTHLSGAVAYILFGKKKKSMAMNKSCEEQGYRRAVIFSQPLTQVLALPL